MQSAVAKLLADVERRRQAVSNELTAKHRASLGQFFTPRTAAELLAQLLDLPDSGRFRLLDPGAGVGSLSAAVVARVVTERPDLDLHVTAFEIDDPLILHLTATLEDCVAVAAESGVTVDFEVRDSSFVEYATGWLFEVPEQFDAGIATAVRPVTGATPRCSTGSPTSRTAA